MKQDYLKYSFWSLLIQTCQESDSSLVNYFRFCPDDSLTLYGNSFVLVVEIKQVKFCHNYKPPSTRLWAWNPIKFGRRARSDSLPDGPFFAILGSNYFMQLAIPGISFSWNDILIFLNLSADLLITEVVCIQICTQTMIKKGIRLFHFLNHKQLMSLLRLSR